MEQDILFSVRRLSAAASVTALSSAASASIVVLMLYRAMGLGDTSAIFELPFAGWVLLVFGISVLCLSLFAFVVEVHRSPPSVTAVSGSQFRESLGHQPALVEQMPSPALLAESASPPSVREEDEGRLAMLSPDERALYEMIEDSGGEILQVKLVSSGEFSRAKVTRLLDKLEGRGLIKRERYGMTNRILLVK